MTRRLALAVIAGLLAAIAPLDAVAQSTQASAARSEWRPVRVAKWALLATAVGFGVYALRHSNEAGEAYDALHRACALNEPRCALEEGRYADPMLETLYQRTLREDRLARRGIVGGQVALLGSVGLFIYDLRNARGPRDIPYPTGRAMAAGIRVTF